MYPLSFPRSLFSFSVLQKEQETKTIVLSASVGALGIIAALTGVLILCNVHQLAGLGILAGGLSLILVAAFVTCIKDTQKENSPNALLIANGNVATLYKDAWNLIFALLAPEDLGHLCQVSKLFNSYAEEKVWQIVWKNDKDVYSQFEPLVSKKLLTWKEVGPSLYFSSFVSVNRSLLIALWLKKNELLQRKIDHSFFQAEISSSKPSHIQVLNRFLHYEKSFLKAEGRELEYLSKENNFLFALTKDKTTIFQWDVHTEQKVRTFATEFGQEKGATCLVFYAVKGSIILIYDWKGTRICERISYARPSKSQFIVDSKIPNPKQVELYGGKIYIYGNEEREDVFIWDFVNKKTHGFHNTLDLFEGEPKVEVRTFAELRQPIIRFANLQEVQKRGECALSDKYFWVFASAQFKSALFVFDLKNRKRVCVIHDVFKDSKDTLEKIIRIEKGLLVAEGNTA